MFMETKVSVPGFKFSPTEEELILYYLRRKIEGFQKGVEAIPEIDITRHEPWDLPDKSIIPSNNDWYFFSPRGTKYPKGRLSKRATQFGYWKATGKKRNVKSGNRIVGSKRTLVFHKGRPQKWERTEWIMHEYCMSGTPQESFVVCRVHNRKNCEFKCNDIPPKELIQPLTEESNASTLADNLQHTGNNEVEMFQELTPLDQCNNPDLVYRFDFEYDEKPGNIMFQHSVERVGSESEYEKKPGNILFQDESCSLPKFQDDGGVTDDCFADKLNDDIMMLDESSFAKKIGNNLMDDDSMDFEFEQPIESRSRATLDMPTLQGTSPPIIKIRSRQRVKPIKALPFQGTAPRRIRMKLQNIDKPPEEASCVRDETYHNVGVSADLLPSCFVTRMLDVTVNHQSITVLVVVVLLGWCFFLAHKFQIGKLPPTLKGAEEIF